jgi:hypothetical protein
MEKKIGDHAFPRQSVRVTEIIGPCSELQKKMKLNKWQIEIHQLL